MLNPKYKITFIGAGNLATQLGLALLKSGNTFVQVYSLHSSSSSKLAKLLKCKSTNKIKEIDTSADIYIIAISDSAISKVAKQLKLKNKIIIHTSGSMDMKVLKTASKDYGVFYPIQTFSKEIKIDFKNIPLCIEASNTETYKTVELLSKSLSTVVKKINTKQRRVIHLSAVFANNFTNHLYVIASEILKQNKLSFDLLKPLIEETANKVKNNPPVEMQTGPAKRQDKITMKANLKLLTSNKDYRKVYKLLSKSIIDSTLNNK